MLLFAGLLAGCGEAAECPPADAGGEIDGATDEETSLLEGAMLDVTCSGPNVIGMASFELTGARRVTLADGESGIELVARGDARVEPPTAEAISRGVNMQGVAIECQARFIPIQGGLVYLNLLCQYPAIVPAASSFTLAIHAQASGGVVSAEAAEMIGIADGTSVCDGTLPGSTAIYNFTLVGTPPQPVANVSRTITGG